MLKDKDTELDEMEEETTEAFDYGDRDDRNRTGGSGSSPGGSLLKPILIAAVGLMLLIIVLLVLSGRGRNDIKLEEKVAVLEAKIAQLEEKAGKSAGLPERLATLEQEQIAIKDSVADSIAQLDRNQRDIGAQLQSVVRQLETSSRQASRPAASKPAARPAPAPKAAAKPAAKKAAQASSSGIYTVQPGDTLYRIGLKHNLTVDKLRQFNGLTAQDVIQPGQKLKVSP